MKPFKNVCYSVVSLVTVSGCFVASSQTPIATDSPTQRQGSRWGSNYQVPGPKEGLVPDKETAIKIAEVVLFRLYSEGDITRQRPYKVKLEDDIWWISGTMKDDELGSVFTIAISKQTGEILHL